MSLPSCIDSYWDTLLAIRSKKTHRLHPEKWKQDHPDVPPSIATDNTMTLESLWRKLNDKQGQPDDDAAHSVLFDVEMNIEIATHSSFWKYAFQKTSGMRPIAPLWKLKAAAEHKRQQDVYYPIPPGWQDIAAGLKKNPRDDPQDTYRGPTSGPKSITSAVKLEPDCLAEIFLAFLPLDELKKIAHASTLYATQQPVKRIVNDKGLFVRYQPCEAGAEGATVRSPSFKGMTEASLLAFLGVCYLMGAYGVQSIHDPWSKDPALRKADIADIMKEEVFKEHLHFISFASLHDMDTKDENPLRKVKPFSQVVCSHVDTRHESYPG